MTSDNVDSSALEADCSVGGCEQRVVLAHADVVAGEELGAALPDEDRSGLGRLAAVQLDASVLRIAVSAVSRRALSLFMCHNSIPLINKSKIVKFSEIKIVTIPFGIVQKFFRFVKQMVFSPS